MQQEPIFNKMGFLFPRPKGCAALCNTLFSRHTLREAAASHEGKAGTALLAGTHHQSFLTFVARRS